MFADDLMLFCKADAPLLHILMKTLQVSSVSARLKANL